MFLRQIINKARALRCFLRDGGASYVNVSQIGWGNSLPGSRILITGGGSGIGLAIAKKCISEGAHVVVTGRNLQKLEKAKRACPTLCTMPWDVSDVGNMKSNLNNALKMFPEGDFDILVNNAGVHPNKGFREITEVDFDSVASINVKGLFFITQAVVEHWENTSGNRKILNVASSGGFLGATEPYRMSKWSVVGLTRGLALDLFPYGIIVNAIAPGMTSSAMIGIDANDNAYVSHYPPSYRVALPEEIAELAVFLLSKASNYIVGQTIICDGGYSLKK